MNNKTTINHYFEFRRVSNEMYSNTTLPLWIKQELSDKNCSILDYGCGFGQLLFALSNEGYSNICGVDIETSALKHCQYNKLNVKQLNIANLCNPFEQKFDVIIFSHIIEHLPKDSMIETLSIVKDLFLNPDGKILVAVPNAQSNTGCYWAYEDFTHSTLFTSGSLYYVLRASGFKSVEFLDVDCFSGQRGYKTALKKILLKLYIKNYNFWNKITNSACHAQSPQIFSYEIKAKAY